MLTKDEQVTLTRNNRLKYFYFIDTDMIKKTIIKNESLEISQRFHMIYKTILDVGAQYIDFLFPATISSSHSIFGENITRTTMNLILLSQVVVFHQCILNEYKNMLNSTFANTQETKHIKLSASTLPTIKPGYITASIKEEKQKQNMANVTTNNSSQYTENMHQIFYNKTVRFLNKKTYSTHLLESSRINKKKSLAYEIHVLKTECTALSYLLTEKTFKAFDTELEKNTLTPKFIEKYNSLTRSYWAEHSVLPYTDALLFDMVLEPAYNFSFFYSLDKLFAEIENEKSPYHRLKQLKGETFNKLLAKHSLRLPITYNKFIFFKYACNALLNSDRINSLYLKPSAIVYDSFTPLTEISRTSASLNALEYYYNLLFYNTLPLIQDLWGMLSNEYSLTLKDYEDFIKANYQVITYDYDTIKEDLIPQSNKVVTFESYYQELQKYIYTPKPASNSKEVGLISHKTPYYNDFCKIIQQSCNVENRMQEYPLINGLIRRKTNIKDPYYREQQAFILNHARNIAEYCRILD